MIHIFKAASDLGVALFDQETEKFVYGELCEKDRLVAFVNSFSEHDVVIFIERTWQEELEEIYFLLPHLRDLAQVKILRKVPVKQLLAKSAKEKKKRNPFFLYAFIGIIVGCLFLMPTSLEYRGSVLIKAQSSKEFTADFVQKQPKVESRQQLYTSISKLYRQVRVEAITYSSGSFKIIFSTANENLKVSDLEGFDKATLKKVSSLENGKDANIHIYELEGSL